MYSLYQKDDGVTKGVKIIIVINTLLLLPIFIPGISVYFFKLFALTPFLVVRKLFVWQVVTYSFLHAGLFHYVFNMLALYMFGREIEEYYGTKRFLIFYFTCAIFSGIISIPFMWNNTIVGASGAIFGVLYVFAKMFPNRQIILFFLFPVPASIAVWIFGAISLFSALSSSGSNIAHFTHLGGLFTAWVLWRYKNIIEDYFLKRKYRIEESARKVAIKKKINKENYYRSKVDPILKKVSEYGLHSLTNKEKKILSDAKKYK